MTAEIDARHCHADGAGPCLADDCPIADGGLLFGRLRPCPGASGPQHPAREPRSVENDAPLSAEWLEGKRALHTLKTYTAAGDLCRYCDEPWPCEAIQLHREIARLTSVTSPGKP